MNNFTILQSVYKKDSPNFLEECFSSILSSTVQPKQIILVKDGLLSKELNNVIENWQQKLPLKVVGYEENKGLAYALNYGLQFVETDLVARMDSDDIVCPSRFEDELSWFTNHPEGIIVGGAIKEFYKGDDGEIFERVRQYPEKTSSTSKTLFKGTPIAHPTMMMKTEILKKFKYSTDTNMNEDIDLWFRLIENNIEINTLQNVLLNFRITDGTFKRRSLKKSFNEYRIYVSNLYKLFGISYLYIYPFARLLTRFMPSKIIKILYFSKIRKRILGNKD